MSITPAGESVTPAGEGTAPRRPITFPLRLARALLSLEWLFLLLLLPLTLTIGPGAALLLVTVPVLWTVRRIAWGQFVPATPLNIPILLLLLIVLAGTQTTINQALSLPPVVRTVYGVGVFFAAAAFARRSVRHFAWSVALYVGMGLAIGALGLVATEWPVKFPLLSPLVQRLPASLKVINPNYLASVLLWFTPLVVALAGAVLAAAGAVRRRTGALPAALLVLASLVMASSFLLLHLLTQSRGGLLGLAAALAFLALVLLLRRPRLLLLVVLLGVLAAALVQRYTSTAFWLDLAGVSAVADLREPATYGLADRVEIWQRALYVVEDFPFTGAGMGTFERIVPLLYPFYTLGQERTVPHAHNQLLQVAAELGIPGLLAYLALWLVAAALLVAIWRRARNPAYRFLALGFGASLLGFFVHGLAEAVPLGDRPSFIFWYLLGLIVALHQLVSRAVDVPGSKPDPLA